MLTSDSYLSTLRTGDLRAHTVMSNASSHLVTDYAFDLSRPAKTREEALESPPFRVNRIPAADSTTTRRPLEVPWRYDVLRRVRQHIERMLEHDQLPI